MTKACWDVIQAEAMTCQSTPDLIPQEMFVSHGNQMMTYLDMLQFSRSRLEKRQQEQLHNRQSRERTAEQLFHALESVALVVKGSDLDTTEDPFCANSKMHQ